MNSPPDPRHLGALAAAIVAQLKPPIGATAAAGLPPAPARPEDHPLVLAVLARFPGAAIVAVRTGPAPAPEA